MGEHIEELGKLEMSKELRNHPPGGGHVGIERVPNLPRKIGPNVQWLVTVDGFSDRSATFVNLGMRDLHRESSGLLPLDGLRPFRTKRKRRPRLNKSIVEAQLGNFVPPAPPLHSGAQAGHR